MDERWKPIAGFDGAYEISDMGRFRSLDRLDALGRKIKGRLMVNARKSRDTGKRGNYYRIRLSHNGRVYDLAIHALVLISFVGPRPPGMDACHNDGDIANNRLSNLRWDTSKGNQRDKIAHGTVARGERNGSAKLTGEDVAAIKASNEGPTALGRRFGVSRIQIQRIRNGQAWAHVAVTALAQLQG